MNSYEPEGSNITKKTEALVKEFHFLNTEKKGKSAINRKTIETEELKRK